MAAVPIYVWNGTAWQETGPVIPASPIKYQASAPSSPSTGDIWVDSDGDVTTGSQQFQRFRFVASGGETSISGVDANGATLAYTAGTEIVALNGSTLVRGQDYTATNGTSITGLSPALVANDVVEVFSFMAFNVANTYTQSQVDGLLADYVGLRLINTTTIGNAVTSFAVPNGTFTSTYDAYKIIVDFSTSTAQSSSGAIRFKLRANGVDSSTGYNFNGFDARPGGLVLLSDSGTTSNYIGSYLNATPTRFASTIEIQGPALAVETKYQISSTCMDGGTNRSSVSNGFHTVATAYDSINFILDSGTVTGGKVRVYGYKN